MGRVSITEHKADAEMFRLPRRQSNVDVVIGKIKDMLSAGKLYSGSRLPSEMELAESLGVSRGSVREAMKILSAFGVVSINQGDGTYIGASANKQLLDPLFFSLILTKPDKKNLAELRELIEIGIVKLVIQNAADSDLKAIKQEHQNMLRMVQDGQVDAKTLASSDIDFHAAMGRASKNELVERLYSFVLDFLSPSIEETHRNDKAPAHSALRTHKRILDALFARDVDEAINAIRASHETWMSLL